MFLSEQILWLPFADGRFLLYSDPFHAPAKALGIQQPQLRLRPDPLKSAVGQPPVQKNIAVSCPAQCLDPVPTSVTEKKQGIGKGVQFKLLLYNRCRAVNSSV